MAKKKEPKKRANKYDDKLAISGSLDDVLKASFNIQKNKKENTTIPKASDVGLSLEEAEIQKKEYERLYIGKTFYYKINASPVKIIEIYFHFTPETATKSTKKYIVYFRLDAGYTEDSEFFLNNYYLSE